MCELAVAGTEALVEHYCIVYKKLFEDIDKLNSVYILKYEDFIDNPQDMINKIFDFLGLNTITIRHKIKNNINQKYFIKWNNEDTAIKNCIIEKFNIEVQKYGYHLHS